MENSFSDSYNKRKPFTISQITSYIKAILTEDVLLSELLLEGEVSNCKNHSSGHIYFTLKDSQASLSAVMFRSNASKSGVGFKFELVDGMKVRCCGRVSVYEKTGQYQLYADWIEPFGKGNLYAEFERLKRELSAEGLFSIARKRAIPDYPKKIAVVTSPTGAAVRDIINVIKRRAPKMEIVVAPAIVQGDSAPKSIADAISLVNEWGLADVLIVGRGGGSMEDLWAFNEELVARAIFSSKTPVISAVGHETDFTIADFVADLRAPTPSAAAELAVYNLQDKKSGVESLIKSLEYKMEYNLRIAVEAANRLENSLNREMTLQLERKQSYAQILIGKLEALSPLNVLSRGFAFVNGVDGVQKKSIKQFRSGENITITLKDGTVEAEVI